MAENGIRIIKSGFVPRDDTELEYQLSGNPDGEVLLMLAGNGGDLHCFEDGIYGVMAERYKILRFSTRGTGSSARGSQRLTFELFSEDLRALLDYLKIPSVRIFGFSDGGNLGIVFTLKYPPYVTHLAVMGSNINTCGTNTRDQLGIILSHRKYAVSYALKKDESIALKRDIEGLMVGQPRLKYKDLNAIDIPFLNIFGEFDMIKRRHSRRITRAVKGGEEIMVLSGGHGTAFKKREFLLEPVLLHFFG